MVEIKESPLYSNVLSDEIVIYNAIEALSHLISDGEKEEIQQVIDSNVVPRMIELLGQDEDLFWTDSLKTLKQIAVGGNDTQLQYIIDSNALAVLRKLLLYPSARFRRVSAWFITYQ